MKINGSLDIVSVPFSRQKALFSTYDYSEAAVHSNYINCQIIIILQACKSDIS